MYVSIRLESIEVMRLAVTFAVIVGALATQSKVTSAQSSTIPAGVPLRIQVDHRYRVREGVRIEGHLIAPIYEVDHKVLPVATRISGVIAGTHRAPHGDWTRSILDGNFVPARIPEIHFDGLHLPDGTMVKIETSVMQRDATVVKMSVSKKHSSLAEIARQEIENRKREGLDALHHPNLGDRIEKWIYAQLPGSPSMIWTGTQFDAELTGPVKIPGPESPPLPQAETDATPTGIVEARLTVDLNSAKDRHGAPVMAVLTRPLLTPDGKQVIFPEGAKLEGLVTESQPARWFSRNGRLRFTFRSIDAEGKSGITVHGQLAGAEASGKVKISEEGTATASSGPDKYLAPMALGLLTVASYGDDAAHAGNSAVISNGFGFVARVAAMASANAAVGRGFAYFALSKSIYYRWIARGREVQFPKDTQIEILLNNR
jgi:hypothetical protein